MTGVGEVPVEPLREAVLALGLPWGTVARMLGWTYVTRRRRLLADGTFSERVYVRADTTRVKRVLGLKAYRTRGTVTYSRCMSYGNAVLLCRELGIDPVDVGV